jgi:hypothetical protein
MLKLFLGEFREIFLLASTVTGLSILAVGLAIVVSWQISI